MWAFLCTQTFQVLSSCWWHTEHMNHFTRAADHWLQVWGVERGVERYRRLIVSTRGMPTARCAVKTKFSLTPTGSRTRTARRRRRNAAVMASEQRAEETLAKMPRHVCVNASHQHPHCRLQYAKECDHRAHSPTTARILL